MRNSTQLVYISSIFSCNLLDFEPIFEASLLITLFETENERQKTKPVPILLPRAFRNFPDVKTRNKKQNYNWTLEIIPFIWEADGQDL